jgi:hypothetical protein
MPKILCGIKSWSFKPLREPSGSGKVELNNSDGCRPPQPKFLRFQSLPQTLQPSEFVCRSGDSEIQESCV